MQKENTAGTQQLIQNSSRNLKSNMRVLAKYFNELCSQ